MRQLMSLVGVGVVTVACLSAAVRAEGVSIGEKAPNFTAEAVDGKTISLSDTKGAQATVLCFTCNDCPVAIAYEDRFIEFAKKYADKEVKFIAINVNRTETLEAMRRRAEEKKFNFPYAYDDSGESAKAYGARVTPHLFIIDGDGVIAYMGAYDDNMAAGKVEKRHVESAVDALLAGRRPEVSETKAVGCSIKR